MTSQIHLQPGIATQWLRLARESHPCLRLCSYFMGFGRPNPSKARQAAEKEEEEERPDDGANEEKQREQSAEDRDKEEKDKWRSWKAKLGLVSG